MIATYKGHYYYYVHNPTYGVFRIITCQKDKALDGFSQYEHDKRQFIKVVTLDDLTDAFNVSYWATYDSGIPGKTNEWPVGDGYYDVDGKMIKIYAQGRLPGWLDGEERYECHKYLRKEDVKVAKIVKEYIRRNGVTLDTPETVVEIVDGETLVKTQLQFLRFNI